LVTPPCGGISYSKPSNIYSPGEKVEIRVYQAVSHYTNTSQNTYQYNVLNSQTNAIISSETFQQSQFSTGNGVSFAIKSADTPLQSTPGFYTLQLVFNATSGGGEVYYSCIDYEIRSGSSGLQAASVSLLALLTLLAVLLN
jgi:hypothetical protein